MSLTIEDFKLAAEKLEVGVPEIRAIATVESSGKGFFNDGRPVILYERHIFFRELSKKKTEEAKAKAKVSNPNSAGQILDLTLAAAARNAVVEIDKLILNYPDIINTKPGGYKGGIAEYSRLEAAIKIDEECALRSCSWGAFQLMGFHAEFLGYENVQDFVAKMKESEANQLDAFVTFIIKNPSLHKALKEKNWAMVAKNYNGSNYAINKYDIKLLAAFNTFSKNPELA